MALFIGAVLLAAHHVAASPMDGILAMSRDHLRHKLRHHLGHTLTPEKIEDMSKVLLQKAMTEPMHHRDETDWVTEHTEFVRDGVIYYNSTYMTPKFEIMTGASHFTWPNMYHIKVPEGDYVVTNSWWNIVDGSGQSSIPLSELYNHHYLIGNPEDMNPLSMCEDSLFWGGGAEYRRMDYTYPPGYGQIRINATGICGANLHFIRGEDLKLHWEGMNNPGGNHAAALKNCAECGYAPGRAFPECGKFADGSFLCCFTGSRCPVNNPHNRTTKTYRMQYTIEWSRNVTEFKNIRVHCFDLGGAAVGGGMQNENVIDALAEFNAASYLNDEALAQHCNATVCNITRSIVVGEQRSLEDGMCAGEMMWSYVHMHAGAITGSMFVNGEKYCENVPTVGKDPNNAPGDEAGFLVKMSQCVDDNKLGNKIRLNKGDVVTVEALYDVDPNSTTYAPFPGGKRGGVMALFFSLMHCDAGTWNERYVCRQNQCIGVGKGKHLDSSEPQWNTFDDCSKECGVKPAKSFLHVPVPRYQDKITLAPSAEVSSGVEGIGKLYLSTRDCGQAKALTSVQHIGSTSIRLFGRHKIEGTFMVPKDVTGGNIIFKTDAGIAGLTLVDMQTDACQTNKVHTLFGQLTFAWNGAPCPLKAGTNVTISETVGISLVIPKIAAETTTTIVWITPEGDTLFCWEIETTGKPDAYVV